MRRRLLTAALVVVTVLTAAAPAGIVAVPVARAATAPLRILTMGDSLTAGGIGDSYRAELGRLLTDAGVPHEFIVAAVPGISCDGWLPHARNWVSGSAPDLVLLNCGTNDGPQTAAAGQAFEQTYRTLLTEILSGSPTVRVVPAYIQYSAIGGYPYPDKAPAWLAVSEPIVNDAIWRSLYQSVHGTRIAASVDLQVIPEQYLTGDGIHSTVSGYTLTGRLWYRALAPVYGWPDIAPLPCGLSGRRAGWGSPPYAPIVPGCPTI